MAGREEHASYTTQRPVLVYANKEVNAFQKLLQSAHSLIRGAAITSHDQRNIKNKRSKGGKQARNTRKKVTFLALATMNFWSVK